MHSLPPSYYERPSSPERPRICLPKDTCELLAALRDGVGCRIPLLTVPDFREDLRKYCRVADVTLRLGERYAYIRPEVVELNASGRGVVRNGTEGVPVEITTISIDELDIV